MAVAIDTALDVSAYTIPTDEPESDGTLEWSSTTIVVVEAHADGETGLGYTYTDAAAVRLIEHTLAEAIRGVDPLDVGAAWEAMSSALRNIGRSGLAWMALSAVDAALWDLKARVLGQPLVTVLGAARDDVPVYGSGGFTSYSLERAAEQLGNWVAQDGCRYVKMKVGSDPDRDLERAQAARAAIDGAELFVDANGAYTRKQALGFAERYAALGVTWFEEPVSSDDLAGLRLMRDRGPAGMDIAAGEYGYEPDYFRRMLEAGAVDVLQADATRCGGITGFLRAAALADAHMVPLSAHTAPALHLHACCAAPRLRHVEWFHDHVRIERMLFDGAPMPARGLIRPDLTRPGHGLELKRAEAARLAA
jgi:L-alanine-DL-glutamate epimerase-like enolase superfamily enzyme